METWLWVDISDYGPPMSDCVPTPQPGIDGSPSSVRSDYDNRRARSADLPSEPAV